VQIVRPIALPAESRLTALYQQPDLADAFAITLPPDVPADIEKLSQILLATPPCWFRVLLACRDFMVMPFGIQTSVQLRKKLEAGGRERIDFFPVLSVDENELIIGENDIHLDFRTSVLVRNQARGGREVVLTSVVHCHNRIGKLYTRLVAPFHRTVVCSMLARAAARNWR
jgi:hypothetical protein